MSGLCRLLHRLGIHYTRGRQYVHTPDPDYVEKLAVIQACLLRAWYDPEHYVFLYLDEFSYYRQPTVARAYAARGHPQSLACLSHRSNARFRGIAALNAVTGQVTYQQHSRIDRPCLTHFYDTLAVTYPGVQIYVAQDNWPVHYHPDILAHLAPQQYSWPIKTPRHWPSEPGPRVVRANRPIQLLSLPTYASWLNPVEKLWRWVRQAVIHMHRLADDWPALKQRVADFLAGFARGSSELLQYVGLLPT